jgi:glycerate-2-kinase
MGGETTVTIRGNGKGGRNQELALAVLLELKDCVTPFYFCSLGTDGMDGVTDAAGAWIDHRTYAKTLELGLDAYQFLENNDSYHFFQKLGQLIITGPTHTNVMDVIFCFI